LRNKRKRYRNKKKNYQKQVSRQHIILEDICTPVEDTLKNTLKHQPPVNNDVNPKSQETNNMPTSWYYLEPDEDLDTEYQWDEEDLKVLKHQVENEEKAESLYGGYTDMDPCFPRIYQTCNLDLPTYIEPLDKISIRSKFLGMHSKLECVKELARNYRDKCKELKIEVIQMKAQKVKLQAEALEQTQKTRYFWRNQILEGTSRSGRIVRNALKIKL